MRLPLSTWETTRDANEPTTGEINYRNIFRYLLERDYRGVICMEHGRSIKGAAGVRRVIEAYRECDPF